MTTASVASLIVQVDGVMACRAQPQHDSLIDTHVGEERHDDRFTLSSARSTPGGLGVIEGLPA
jgi:hypothetical protein